MESKTYSELAGHHAKHVKGSPVFIFTTGPCSGGGILQRLTAMTKELLVWDTSGLTHQLESLRQMDLAANPSIMGAIKGLEGRRAPRKHRIEPGTDVRPMVGSLRLSSRHINESYRTLLKRLYGLPTKAHGFTRWGLLDQTGGKFAADMLRLLFPAARFIFIARHPADALGEIATQQREPRDRWGKPVSDSDRLTWFAQQWADLAGDFAQIDYGLRLRLEDLQNASQTVPRIADFIGIGIQADLVASITNKSKLLLASPHRLNGNTFLSLKPLLGESMKAWNYS